MEIPTPLAEIEITHGSIHLSSKVSLNIEHCDRSCQQEETQQHRLPSNLIQTTPGAQEHGYK